MLGRYAIGSMATMAAMVALALSSCAPSSARAPSDRGAVPVTVVTAALTSRPALIEALGTVEASESVAVKSRVDGQIRDVLFKEGDRVVAGQPLYRLDDAAAKAQLAAMEAQRERDEAQAHQTQAEFLRVRDLAAKGFESKSALDIARAAAESAVAAAKADVAQADVLKTQLQYYSIFAPIAGRTGESSVKPGADVKANDTTALVTINQLSPVRVRFAIPAGEIAAARAHLAAQDALVTARVHGAGGPGRSGRLVFLDNEVDASNGQLLAKGEFQNADEALWPGALVDTQMQLGTVANLIAVPETAVQLGEAGSFVFVVSKTGSAEMRPVGVFSRADGNANLANGVAAGERIVVDGAAALTPGAKVVVAQVANKSTGGARPTGQAAAP